MFHAAEITEAAVTKDIPGLGRPRGMRARTGQYQQVIRTCLRQIPAIGRQQFVELIEFGRFWLSRGVEQNQLPRAASVIRLPFNAAQFRFKPLPPESRKSILA